MTQNIGEILQQGIFLQIFSRIKLEFNNGYQLE